MPNIDVPRDRVAEFCRRHHVRTLALFGSVLRADFGPDSAVDALVEFDAEARVGLITLSAMELELGALLQRKVDLRTPADLSRYFREEVVRAAEPLYAE